VEPERVELELPPDAATLGPPDAPLTLVVFADFHCEPSARYAPVYRAAKGDFGDDLRLAFVHMPVRTLHPRSEIAARAAWAAARQGRFWSVHDKLFELGAAGFRPAAVKQIVAEAEADGDGAPFDSERFRVDFVSRSAAAVRAHVALARQLRVDATPYAFLNGIPLRGAKTEEDLRLELAQELQRVRAPQAPDSKP
jgi:protein-disulfide isomerase